MMYPDTKLFIDGVWRHAALGSHIAVVNPATGDVIGQVSQADAKDLEEAALSADAAFQSWSTTSPLERSNIMRRAAALLRDRADDISRLMTTEQGKPLLEAHTETLAAADIIDWFAEEGRRTYGRVIPARQFGVIQLVVKEPVGPVAAFTPWNFPINQVVRKVSAAIACGCTVVAKGPEETPASPAALIQCFVDAGLPRGVVNLVFGIPSEVSSYLIPHPLIRKISFTGSVPVGKQLAALAGQHMKRVTMELGGHGPAIIFDDADIANAAERLVMSKFRNAGQVCVAPTRFIVQRGAYEEFLDRFVGLTKQIRVGNGLENGVTMGPLVNERRLSSIDSMVKEAVTMGAKAELGGRRLSNKGSFYEPTVLTGVTPEMSVMQSEPFGPVALMMQFDEPEEAIKEANRLPYGLAAYAWTKSVQSAALLSSRLQTGMLTINHLGLALAELPFGGVKESGYGSEGGSEAMESYLSTKIVSQNGL
jgi:succinate-semialdehyde dehydrogenase / glutarate-semialdehyde dehydrogenase